MSSSVRREPTARDVAPRLWKALRDERAYQAKVAEQRRRGAYTRDVMLEESVRFMRRIRPWVMAHQDAVQKLIVNTKSSTEAFRKLDVMMRSPVR